MVSNDIEAILRDIEHLSNKDKVEYLLDYIDEEKDKPDDQVDDEFIVQCTHYINEFSKGDAFDFSKEELDVKLEELRSRGDQSAAKIVRSKKRIFRRFAVVAAAVLLLGALGLTAIAKISGFSRITDYFLHIVEQLKPGDRLSTEGITFIHNGDAVRYDDMQTLFSSEKLDIMYPTALPDGVWIEQIIFGDNLNGTEQSKLLFVFNDSNISLEITNYYTVDSSANEYSLYEVNNTEYKIIHRPTGGYQAIYQSEIYQYRLTCSNYSDLEIMLKGLKK